MLKQGQGVQELPQIVDSAARRLEGLFDTCLPHRLEGLYLVGSVSLGDYVEGQSDVDFVAVLTQRVAIPALAEIHSSLAIAYPGMHIDGIHLQSGELSAPPGGSGPEAREGLILPNSVGERHAVTWLTLAERGMALRGKTPEAGWIAADPGAAVAYCRANLDSYWRKWLETRRPASAAGSNGLPTGDEVAWGCLGIARLHATITTGKLPSKTRAGEHALKAFPAHARIVSESLRLRHDPRSISLYTSLDQRRSALIAFMDAVLGSVPA